MNQPQPGHRFVADYVQGEESLFRLIIQLEQEGWGAYIFDRRQTDAVTGKPLEAFFGRVADPQEGKIKADRMLAWLLGRNDLPLQNLMWRETPA
jgi:hypothetical protein